MRHRQGGEADEDDAQQLVVEGCRAGCRPQERPGHQQRRECVGRDDEHRQAAAVPVLLAEALAQVPRTVQCAEVDDEEHERRGAQGEGGDGEQLDPLVGCSAGGHDGGRRQSDEQHGADRGLGLGDHASALSGEGRVEVGHGIHVAQRGKAEQGRAREEAEGEGALAVPVAAEVGGRDEQEGDEARHGRDQPEGDDRPRDPGIDEVEGREGQGRAPVAEAPRDERVERAVRHSEYGGEDRDRGDLHDQGRLGVREQECEGREQGEGEEEAGLERRSPRRVGDRWCGFGEDRHRATRSARAALAAATRRARRSGSWARKGSSGRLAMMLARSPAVAR